MKLGWWNVAGLYNKDRQFWEYVENFDYIGLIETWVDKKQWRRMEENLPDTFNWKCQYAEKEKNKGRASGGIITGVNKKIKETEVREEIKDLQEKRIMIEGKVWKILTVYSREMKKTRESIERLIDKGKEKKLIIGGDFNARTGTEGSFSSEERREKERRSSKDKVKNAEGARLIEMAEENGWEILNGNMEGDENGEFTFIGGKGNSVIDYVLVDASVKSEVKSFKIGDRVESDHLPMRMEMYRYTERGKQEEVQWKERRLWTEEGKKYYLERIEEIYFEKEEPNDLMEEMAQKINSAILKRTMRINERKIGWKKWWDRECTESKREARKALRRWKQGRGDRETYSKKRKEYKKICEGKRVGMQERIEEEIKQIRNKNDIWKFINRERKRRIGTTKKVKIQEWTRYFMELLEGQERKSGEDGKAKEKGNQQEEGDESITEGEVNIQIKKLKKGKAAGGDELGNEVWAYGGRKVLSGLTKLINKVWKGEGLPENWREGIICPILRKETETRLVTIEELRYWIRHIKYMQ